MSNYKISIIVPTYNRDSFLERTILSVQNQTINDWELLIIDDGSTDKTREIVENFIKKDKRIKYFYQENSGGPASPKNIGLANATGKYVAFLDSDDEWFPQKLEKQIKIFESSNNKELGIVTCFLYIKEDKTEKVISKCNTFYRGNVTEKLVKSNFPITSSCIMTKLSILKEAGNFDNEFKVSDDWDMWLRISELGYQFDFVPEYLLNYFVHDKNIYYRNSNFNGEKEFIIFCSKHIDLFLKYNSMMLGYYYFLTKNSKLSRKYFMRMMIDKDSNIRQRVKSFGCLVVSFFPKLEKGAKKIWRSIRNF